MSARMFHFQVGQGQKLGWVAKLALSLIGLLLIALLLTFGLVAAVVGGVALLALKVVRALKPAGQPMPEEEPSWLRRRESVEAHESLESGSVVRDVEVEVLSAEDGPSSERQAPP